MELKVFRRSRSPFRFSPTPRPLRVAGQSLDEEIVRLRDKWDQTIFIPAFLCVVLTWLEWYRWWFSLSPNPWLLTAITIPVCLYSIWRTSEYRNSLDNLKLGRDGERIVAECLEELRPLGYKIFHDVNGPGFNVDHVIIGPAGIFAVETKTLRKPTRGNPQITYDGTSVRVEGRHLFRDPLIQAKAQAHWLDKLINNGRKRSLPVRSILLFPSWWVNDVARPGNEAIWVLNPKRLPGYLEKEPPMLGDQSIEYSAGLIGQYIRLSYDRQG